MAPDLAGGLRSPAASGKSRGGAGLKKGPWTVAEDVVLAEYVKKHGEGNWNAVQRNSGLLRCGKSCRLRWANHLRPNLKKGAFTPEEEKVILELHANLGNKWARMAAQLPGRTDNEIKNYWNTRLKRRQRAGLPIYPHQMMQYQEHPYHHRMLGPSQSLSSPLSRRQPSNSNHSLYHDPFNHSRPLVHPPNNESCFTSGGGGGGVALSMAATSNLSFSSSSFFDKSLSNLPFSSNLNVPRFVRYDNCDEDFGYRIGTKPDVGELELPSIQSPATTPSSFVTAPVSSGCATGCEAASCRRSGLLEDLLGESRAMAACADKIEENLFVNVREKEEEEDNHHAQNLAGEKGMNDELSNLLDNFPLSVPIPHWDDEACSGGCPDEVSRPDEMNRDSVANSMGIARQDWKNMNIY